MARIHPQPEDKHCIKKRPGQANQTKTKTRRSQFTWGHNNIAGLKEDRQARARTGLSSAYRIHNQWIHCEGQDTERQELKSTTHPQKIQATPEGCKKVGPGFWSGFKGHTTDHRQDRHHTHTHTHGGETLYGRYKLDVSGTLPWRTGPRSLDQTEGTHAGPSLAPDGRWRMAMAHTLLGYAQGSKGLRGWSTTTRECRPYSND
ncbi:hypothetical protein CEP53_008773 [Fusarium sp. AF-6]|nr:hypothetical protein CEP53_008773 [Fusarium sp. AF-6]